MRVEALETRFSLRFHVSSGLTAVRVYKSVHVRVRVHPHGRATSYGHKRSLPCQAMDLKEKERIRENIEKDQDQRKCALDPQIFTSSPLFYFLLCLWVMFSELLLQQPSVKLIIRMRTHESGLKASSSK